MENEMETSIGIIWFYKRTHVLKPIAYALGF